jgi:hypothetical protein
VSTGTPPRSLGESTYWNHTSGEPIDSDDWWFRDEEAVFGSSAGLAKRLSVADISAFGKGLLQCADNGTCASGKCTGDSCEISTQPPGTKKRADSPSPDPMDVDTENCITAMPAIMYNCKYFPDRSVFRDHGPQAGGTKNFIGICNNILNYFATNGLGAGPMMLSYDQQGGGNEGNRDVMCGAPVLPYTFNDANGNPQQGMRSWRTYCQADSDQFSAEQQIPQIPHGNQNWASCDEFPFNR